MAKIKTFELDRWSEPDEQRRVKHIGMADAQETFDKLETHLKRQGLMPDEYFLFSGEYSGMAGELPNFEEAVCIPNFGASEGIYLDISLAVRDEAGKQRFQRFATGKTLGETADDYMRMFRIAAECSLMLNGRGFTYEKENVELTLTPDEALILGSVLDHELCGYVEPKTEKVLSSIMEQINGSTFSTVTALMRHGQDDYSTWTFDMANSDLEGLLPLCSKQTDELEKLMGNCPMLDDSKGQLRLLFREWGTRYSLYSCAVGEEYFSEHQNEGCSVRGSKEEVIFDLTDEAQEQAEDDEGLEL